MATRRLDPSEEKVVRMRRGLPAPDSHELEMMGQNHPDTLAKLREIENRAFQMSGRIDELRAEAVVTTTKDKIVARLKNTGPQAEAPATAPAPAPATVSTPTSKKRK